MSPLNLSEFIDDEIGNLARKLQHYHELLKALLIREKKFSSNENHELLMPVTSIGIEQQSMWLGDKPVAVRIKKS